jgi:hypothetical protein
MLDLFVNFMRYKILILLTFLTVAAQATPLIAITTPSSGEVVTGVVTVRGTTDVDGFASYQLDFSYASNPTDTWFTLHTSTQPAVDSPLVDWDTTPITDGDYVLRLRVYFEDGAFQDATTLIKVQNDTPIVSSGPEATATVARLENQFPTPFLVASSPTPTQTPRPTPTPFATNAASLGQYAIYESLGRGALVILACFIIVGLLLRIRQN